MRTVLIVPSLLVGGAESSLAKAAGVIHGFVDRLDIIVLSDVEATMLAQLPPGVGLHVLKGASCANPFLWMKVRTLLKRLKPHVVAGWSTHANLVAVIASLGLSVPRVIVSERNYVPQMYARSQAGVILRWIVLMLMRILYRRAHVVTANSRLSVRFLKTYIGRGPTYTELPNLIDTALVNDYARLPPELLPDTVPGPKILAIGRLHIQKGFDLLLEAMALVRRTYSWTIVLVGDGPEKERLQRLAGRLGIESAIQWIGAVKNPFPYYRWADLVVLPSRFEGFPNVALEAMSCGRTVICAECKSGPRELTLGGRYGVLVPPNDVGRLAEEIIAWGLNQQARDAMGRSATQHIRTSYDIGRLRRRYVQTLCMP